MLFINAMWLEDQQLGLTPRHNRTNQSSRRSSPCHNIITGSARAVPLRTNCATYERRFFVKGGWLIDVESENATVLIVMRGWYIYTYCICLYNSWERLWRLRKPSMQKFDMIAMKYVRSRNMEDGTWRSLQIDSNRNCIAAQRSLCAEWWRWVPYNYLRWFSLFLQLLL